MRRQRRPADVTVEQWFWSQVRGGDVDVCWLWAGWCDRNGYGRFQAVAAHRWAYEHMRAEIPEGLYLDHLCRVPPCVNPWHLEPVTVRENFRRGLGYGSQDRCPQGHLYDEMNTYVWRGGRKCRTCNTERQRRFVEAHPDYYRRRKVAA